ncbi:MAG: hypothetical protein HQM14_21235 [SAR324 cluster bacterium]|nr:hypothetical protein [SAR324 cluster bacterium]
MLLHIVLKQHIELNLFAVIAAIVVILHYFALAGELQLAAHAVFYLGLGSAVVSIFLYVVSYPFLAKDLLSPGIIVFVVLGALYWFSFKDLGYGGYDEIINWGLAVKEMNITHQFPGIESPVSPKAHPRGPNLFQYFFVINTFYREGTVYLAHFLFQLAPLMVLFNKVSWKNFHWILLMIASVFYFIQGMGVGIISLYVDHILSIYFAMILYVFLVSNIAKRYTLLMVPALAVLPLIKITGFFLSLLAIATVSVDFFRQFLQKTWTTTGTLTDLVSIEKKTEVLSIFLTFSLLMGAPLLSYYSWQNRLKSVGVQEQFSVGGVSHENIINDFSQNASENKKMIIKNFLEFIWEKPFISTSEKSKIYSKFEELSGIRLPQLGKLSSNLQLSLLNWMILMSLVYLTAFFLQSNREAKCKLILTYVILTLNFVIFLFFLLLHYMYSFGAYEAQRLASSNRYASIFFIAFCLLGFGFLLQLQTSDFKPIGRSRLKPLIGNFLGLFIIFGVYVTETPASRGIFSRHGMPPIRQILGPQIQFIRSKVSPDSKIFVVYQNSPTGHISMIHDLFPIETSKICSSLGKPYTAEDPWTCDISPAEWEKLIIQEKSDYVFLGKADDQFWERYIRLFTEETHLSDFLFKVNQVSKNHIRLSPIR